MKEKNLFPSIEPREKGFLQVSKIHSIYWERSGNPKGKKILVIHGGPGGGSQPRYRRYFNPEKFDIVQFDQRGCGSSRPFSELRENTTGDLVNDIEKLRIDLNIDSWHLFGGSWGSTLALIYAIKNPSKVKSMTLRGIFLCRSQDIQWFYQKGADSIYPEYWIEFIDKIPSNERTNILEAFHKRIHGTDKNISDEMCKRWAIWEGKCSTLYPSPMVIDQFDKCSISLSKIETHFFYNNCFIDENEIIKNVHKIENIKCEIIHGRYDIVCPFQQAYDLNKAYVKSKMNIIEDAGHSLLEPGISKKVLEIFTNHENLIT